MSATFWITTNCNLNCKYCYEGEDKLNKSMSKGFINKAIEFTLDYFEKTNEEELIIPKQEENLS